MTTSQDNQQYLSPEHDHRKFAPSRGEEMEWVMSLQSHADLMDDRVAAMEKLVVAAEALRYGVRFGLPAEAGQLAVIDALDEYLAALSRSDQETRP